MPDELQKDLEELEILYTHIQYLKGKMNELREKIYDEMLDNNLYKCSTDNIIVKRECAYKINVPRENSLDVYNLLEQNGFSCLKNDSTLRNKIINTLIKEEGSMPEFLDGLVTYDEPSTVSIELKN